VVEDAPITIIIVDNETTGMTGGQDSKGTGRLEDIVAGLGVPKEHLHIIEPLKRNHEENVDLMKRELFHHGLSVIIERRECIQTAGTSKKEAKG
jgi:indolepyruvate ferredoxin oxidoreductase, alpha subunit